MIEKDFDIPFIANLALREKQIQQNYRPIIAVHKWFARRPGTLFRGLLLSEFASSRPLREAFYLPHELSGIRVADPFMGGGTPILEANRIGCNVVGFDINPMAYRVVREELETLDVERYLERAEALRNYLATRVGELYRTACTHCGADADVKYFLWVKVVACRGCGEDIHLFPGYLLAKNQRHPRHVLVCASCLALCEVDNYEQPGACAACGQRLITEGAARRNRVDCAHCGESNAYPDPDRGPPRHHLFAIEYHCRHCKPRHQGRFFKRADAADRARVETARARWRGTRARFVPEDLIATGDESTRLHRWGYRRYRETFNARQLLGLEMSARWIAAQSDERIRHALETNLSDLLRYQNMLCRYDTMALKSLDVFSIHGFPVSLIQAESNLLGIPGNGKRSPVGSGGWLNIIEKYAKAKAYCIAPYEIAHVDGKKRKVPIHGEWIGGARPKSAEATRMIELHCADATSIAIPDGTLDAVLTDPPYAGNVQYAELMDYCYVWLRRLAGAQDQAFSATSTRHAGELTINEDMGRDLAHFAEGLSHVVQRMARALKPGAPLAFTYHHNQLEAYVPVTVAILDAGLICSATLPCPAEMAASIHINGTESSIIDTVFVCRSRGTVPRNWLAETPEALAGLVRRDLNQLEEGGIKPTKGDERCIAFGHLARLAIWRLRETWKRDRAIKDRFVEVSGALERMGGYQAVEPHLLGNDKTTLPRQHRLIEQEHASYEADAVSF